MLRTTLPECVDIYTIVTLKCTETLLVNIMKKLRHICEPLLSGLDLMVSEFQNYMFLHFTRTGIYKTTLSEQT